MFLVFSSDALGHGLLYVLAGFLFVSIRRASFSQWCCLPVKTVLLISFRLYGDPGAVRCYPRTTAELDLATLRRFTARLFAIFGSQISHRFLHRFLKDVGFTGILGNELFQNLRKLHLMFMGID